MTIDSKKQSKWRPFCELAFWNDVIKSSYWLIIIAVAVLIGIAVYYHEYIEYLSDWKSVEETTLRLETSHTDNSNKKVPIVTKPIEIKEILSGYLVGKNTNKENLIMAQNKEYDPLRKQIIVWKIKIGNVSERIYWIPFDLIVALGGIVFGYIINSLKKRINNVYNDYNGDKYERLISHLNRKHKWILNYGLSRVYHEAGMQKGHYYDALKLITGGFKKLCLDKEEKSEGTPLDKGPIKIILFNEGTPETIKIKLEDEKDGQSLKKLYEFWNALAGDRDYFIRRVFISDTETYNNSLKKMVVDQDRKIKSTLLDWYDHHYSKIGRIHIDGYIDEVEYQIKKLEGDLDFAIYAYDEFKLCVGFICDKLTYVLLRKDGIGDCRDQLYCQALGKMGIL